MKFVFRTIVGILIRFVIILVPVSLFVAFFSLGQRGIPLWNIGVRNIGALARSYTTPIVVVSYLIATLLTVALIDKTKVRSILALHLPPLLAGVIIMGLVSLVSRNSYPLPIVRNSLSLGYRVFLKDEVFNVLEGRSMLLRKTEGEKIIVYMYDENRNTIEIVPGVSVMGKKPNTLAVDEQRRALVLTRSEKGGSKTTVIPFGDFRSGPSVTHNPFIRFFVKVARGSAGIISDYAEDLGRRDRYLFYAALFLSVLMISVPLTFALNDAGWGFSGLTGAVFVLALLPYLYWGVFSVLRKTGLARTAGYGYLFPCAIVCLLGIFVDLLIKMKVAR